MSADRLTPSSFDTTPLRRRSPSHLSPDRPRPVSMVNLSPSSYSHLGPSAPPLIRSRSSASISGNAIYSATPPPMPSRPSSPAPVGRPGGAVDPVALHNELLSISSSKLLVRRAKRSPKLSLFLLVVAAGALYLLVGLATPTTSLLTLAYYKTLDRAYSERWGWPLAPVCSLRKKPVVFVRGQRTAAVVWETNGCGEEVEWGLRLRGEKGEGHGRDEWEEAKVESETIYEETEREGARVVYTAALEGLDGYASYRYELVRRTGASSSTFARASFPWIGARFPTAFHVPVGKPPPPLPPTTLHIACLADNQFNLRVFRRILLRLSSFGRSLPFSTYFASAPSPFSSSIPQPHLILHAGDIVQNPHDLAQWQTDAFDPLTRSGAFSSTSSPPPILLARGNHDWDATGRNPYTGGLSPGASLRANYLSHLSLSSLPAPPPSSHRGTYYAFSPHPRFRILVLDSNLQTGEEQQEQEKWVRWETGRSEWRRASIKAAVVHTAPWIEWWDERAWTEGEESQWSAYVRRSLLPFLAQSHCTLLLSGHSHAYTRGFLPYNLIPSFSAASSSSTLPPLALAAARSRGWERAPGAKTKGKVEEAGMLLLTFGGAGGSLDEDRVEDWGFMGKSEKRKHHFGWLVGSFAGVSGGGEGGGGKGKEHSEPASMKALDGELARQRTGSEPPRVYQGMKVDRCGNGERETRDAVEWRAVDVEGREMDRVWLVGVGCL